MFNDDHLTVAAMRKKSDHIEYDVFAYGRVDPFILDMVADELKKQGGTYEYSEMEQYLASQELQLTTQPNSAQCPEPFHVRIGHDVSIRDPKSRHNLLSASADGTTPAAARRKLADKISGQVLIECPMLPIKREYQVPVFGAGTATYQGSEHPTRKENQ